MPAELTMTVLAELHGLESWTRQTKCSELLRLAARREDELADVVSLRATVGCVGRHGCAVRKQPLAEVRAPRWRRTA